MGWFKACVWASLAAFFASPLAAEQLQPVANTALREWASADGAYGTRGRLVAVSRGHARILRDDGHYCVVPLARLSTVDVAYVTNISQQHREIAESEPIVTTPVAALAAEPVDLIHLRVSAELLAQLTASYKTISRADELILDTPVRSIARTVADVDLLAQADVDKAVLVLPVTGEVTTKSISDSGIVRVKTLGRTKFEKTLRVTVSAEGINVEPVSLDAKTRYGIKGISTSVQGCLLKPVVLRIAGRRVAASFGEASRIGAARERRRLDREIDEFAADVFAPMNRGFHKFVNGMTDVAESQRLTPRFESTDNAVRVTVSGHALTPTSVATPPPMPTAPFVAQVHSSVFDDILRLVARIDTDAVTEEMPLMRVLGKGDIVWIPDPTGTWLTAVWKPRAGFDVAKNSQ